MKAHELRQLDFKEVKEKYTDKVEELANLKFQHALRQLDNTIKVRTARRELARLKTLLREHELGIRRLNEGDNSGEGR